MKAIIIIIILGLGGCSSPTLSYNTHICLDKNSNSREVVLYVAGAVHAYCESLSMRPKGFSWNAIEDECTNYEYTHVSDGTAYKIHIECRPKL